MLLSALLPKESTCKPQTVESPVLFLVLVVFVFVYFLFLLL